MVDRVVPPWPPRATDEDAGRDHVSCVAVVVSRMALAGMVPAAASAGAALPGGERLLARGHARKHRGKHRQTEYLPAASCHNLITARPHPASAAVPTLRPE